MGWLTLALVAVGWPFYAEASTATWTNNAGGNWSVNGNWNPNNDPNGAAEDAYFTNVSANVTINLNANRDVGRLFFNDNNSYSITNVNRLDLNFNGVNLTQDGSGAVTINSTVRLINNSTWTGNGAGVVTVNGVIGDNAGSDILTKDGSFTLILNAANTTDGLTLNAGVIEFGNNAANGDGTFTINGGTIRAGGGARTLNEPVVVGGDFTVGGVNDLTLSGAMNMGSATRTVTVDNTASTVFSGLISGAAGVGLIKSGSGLLRLSGASANTFTGSTTINAGALDLNKTGALGGTSDVTLNSGGTLLLSGASTDRISDTAGITMSGGALNANDGTETMGALTLTANSVIDLSAGGAQGVLTFANTTWAPGANTLTVNNWTGSIYTSGTDDRIFFSSSMAGSFLSGIQFTGFAAGAFVLSTGEVVPVPEPGTILLGLLLLGLIAHRSLADRARARPSSC